MGTKLAELAVPEFSQIHSLTFGATGAPRRSPCEESRTQKGVDMGMSFWVPFLGRLKRKLKGTADCRGFPISKQTPYVNSDWCPLPQGEQKHQRLAH